MTRVEFRWLVVLWALGISLGLCMVAGPLVNCAIASPSSEEEKSVNVQFKDVPTREVIAWLARYAELELMFLVEPQGVISAEFENIEIWEAIQYVCQVAKLRCEVDKGTLTVRVLEPPE